MSTARTASMEPVTSPPRPPPPSPSASTAPSSPRTVEYLGQRTRLELSVGSFQAVKHHLADTLAMEFTQPLLHSAARTALQLHGAVGYAQAPDLALWTRKARSLRGTWGTTAACRARVLAA
ncbi:acyl-CoA dehydrogenase family protein [Streptomyces sp. NPDC056921]|uniref:acyl-CoA dehydrogenase family protein n=1 Tax=Streptomyces sp. NPDC056921 TaxID=3345966 RepID=UPI00363233DC